MSKSPQYSPLYLPQLRGASFAADIGRIFGPGGVLEQNTARNTNLPQKQLYEQQVQPAGTPEELKRQQMAKKGENGK